ncbi:hypothetical protein KJ652_01650 [Patescibacteria group bacterium]|nr:hypothetical protein [Patescibacteria group bacterium]MBU1123272.1 hypothetical protein [Patescibacteria group bacterium]MBU1911143.1 hypothetical protein [Patescibacteria group bacterium]
MKINILKFAGISILLLIPLDHALAGACDFLSNCGADNVLATAIPVIANLLISVSAGASVLFVVVGAFLMLLSMGEEGQISKGKMSIIYALIGLCITLMSQVIVRFVATKFMGLSYGSTDPDPQPIFDFMTLAVSAMVVIFNSVFALMLVYAGFRMAFARGNADEFNKSRGILIWAIVAAVIVNVAYPLVNAVLNIPAA